MGRPTRTYTLSVSHEGFDLIVDGHARLVRATRTLLPYGAALHAGVQHMAALDFDHLITAVLRCPLHRLGGERGAMKVFVGGSRGIADLADRLIEPLNARLAAERRLQRKELYLVAFHEIAGADTETLRLTYARIVLTKTRPRSSRVQ